MDEMLASLRTAADDLAGRSAWAASVDEQVAVVTAVQAVITVLSAVQTAHIKELDAAGFAGRQGATSMAVWLRDALRISIHTAHRLTALAALTDSRPEVVAAVADGAVTVEQAAVIDAALSDLPRGLDPEITTACQKVLLDEARVFEPGALRRIGERILAHVAPEVAEEALARKLERDEDRANTARGFTMSTPVNGIVRITGSITIEAAAVIQAAIEPLCKPRPTTNPTRPANPPSAADTANDTVGRNGDARGGPGICACGRDARDRDSSTARGTDSSGSKDGTGGTSGTGGRGRDSSDTCGTDSSARAGVDGTNSTDTHGAATSGASGANARGMGGTDSDGTNGTNRVRGAAADVARRTSAGTAANGAASAPTDPRPNTGGTDPNDRTGTDISGSGRDDNREPGQDDPASTNPIDPSTGPGHTDAGETSTEPGNTDVSRASTEPSRVEPGSVEPGSSRPAGAQPNVTEPAVSEPAVTEPVVTEPVVTGPAVSEPDQPSPGSRDLRTAAQRRADALEDICRLVLATDQLPEHGGQRPAVTVTLDYDTLTRQIGTATLNTGEPITASAARRIACDARILPAVLNTNAEVLDVGRSRRLMTGPLRHALNLRDQGCTFPTCDRPPAWRDGHHIRSWLNGGPTNLNNAVLLCRRHHRAVHHDGWQIHMAKDGHPDFTPPPHIDPLQQPQRNHRPRPNNRRQSQRHRCANDHGTGHHQRN